MQLSSTRPRIGTSRPDAGGTKDWSKTAPLGWDLNDQEAAAKACCALLSDWFPATTGEIVHVDGGYHAIGA